MSIVTIKGQATIPKAIRKFLNIQPGETNVDFIVVGDHVELVNNDSINPFETVRGLTQGKLSTNEILNMTREG